MPRLLAKRNIETGNLRDRTVNRLHALVLEFAVGGIAKEVKASDIESLLKRFRPKSPAQRVRFELLYELLDDQL